ncbi:PREDICTED: uncharacterized protein LOC109221921 [Nicotiana attenuata]|uniref:uncharacterized protein LOC109221921 n=1 Tax=Nicotiana attenuata TaxID=49451 RepID=UPI00090543DE|nr:PREDICTED: uncharacterized protein LOC109221921 [Nicotiana attenuata]
MTLTGVKAKELLMWLTLTEICVDDPPTGKIHFKATSGLSRTFPVSAFEVDVPKKEQVKEEVKEDVNEVVNKENKEVSVAAAAAAAVEVKEV